MPDLSTFPWDDLLPYLRDRQVIPIIGSSFCMPGEDGLTLSVYLAQQLASRLKQKWHPGQDLRTMAGTYIADGGKARELYLRLAALLYESKPPVTTTLAKCEAMV